MLKIACASCCFVLWRGPGCARTVTHENSTFCASKSCIDSCSAGKRDDHSALQNVYEGHVPFSSF